MVLSVRVDGAFQWIFLWRHRGCVGHLVRHAQSGLACKTDLSADHRTDRQNMWSPIKPEKGQRRGTEWNWTPPCGIQHFRSQRYPGHKFLRGSTPTNGAHRKRLISTHSEGARDASSKSTPAKGTHPGSRPAIQAGLARPLAVNH